MSMTLKESVVISLSNLSYKEKMAIQFMRNKSAGLQPTSQRAVAEKFGLSAMYVNTVINGKQHGKKSDEWRKKFAAYAGMEWRYESRNDCERVCWIYRISWAA